MLIKKITVAAIFKKIIAIVCSAIVCVYVWCVLCPFLKKLKSYKIITTIHLKLKCVFNVVAFIWLLLILVIILTNN